LFHLSHGNVVASGPDEPVIDKLVELAEALGGRAQGDDGEIYTSSNEWRWPEEEGEGAAPPSGLRGLAAAVREAVRTARDVVMGALAPKPFPVGARVRDPLLGKGEVIGYEYGPLHMIVVKLDDGRVVRRGVLLDGEYAAGLEAVEE
ncbi:MAG: hypothetical protein GWM92_18325, partial [Gemmatimonadetes bacterium]|nr:hypothetical protein [Gemmatimonadota bacterium]NIR80758.1 hypothetical protein [Gemmatimonadota bacterium]NIT89563.1 hypothetical protein [Gemmatimonadota bacterium]NIU33358.1 hypothetical protein [Gemmatimonadota bacterium]NIU37641.1 hypothetical protein [Gemmatimonadota bacterium]